MVVERDGTVDAPAHAGSACVALDEGVDDDERLPAALADRLAFHLDLGDLSWRETPTSAPAWPSLEAIADAAARAGAVRVGDDALVALCEAAQALGIDSTRAPWLALQASRVAAALAGRSQAAQEDVELAARLVLAPRALCRPAAAERADAAPPEVASADEPLPDTPPPSESSDAAQERDDASDDAPGAPDDAVHAESVVAAAQSAIDAGLLSRLQVAAGRSGSSRTQGRSGAAGASTLRGRPAGAQRGEIRSGARLNLIETLRAAAPWQALRRREAGPQRIVVQPADFRVTRFKQRRRTTTVFAIDASGSAALHRLAEAKGAVELLLADCYVRRDQVAVVAFRGMGAELLLPLTRSLVRAKRSLSRPARAAAARRSRPGSTPPAWSPTGPAGAAIRRCSCC